MRGMFARGAHKSSARVAANTGIGCPRKDGVGVAAAARKGAMGAFEVETGAVVVEARTGNTGSFERGMILSDDR